MANIASLRKDGMVRVLVGSGSRTFSEETLEADIAAGAPVNEDGSINLIAYVEWILKRNLNGD